MPPRRKAAAAKAPPPSPPPPPLQGCTIAISGTIPGRTQAAIEREFIKVLGATPTKNVTGATTHLVATETDYNKPSIKVKAAQSLGVPIVTFQWLEDSLNHTARMDEGSYGIGSSQPQSQPQVQSQSQSKSQSKSQSLPIQNRSTRKRSAAQNSAADEEDDDQEEVKPKAKKKSKISKVKAESQEEEETKETKVADGQIAKSRDARIPLDEIADTLYFNYEVYIDDNGVIFDASLNQTNSKANNNKFYRLQLLRSVKDQFFCWTRWGRVGERGQSKTVGDGTLQVALSEFDNKFKSKTGRAWVDRGEPPKPGKYAFVERSYEPDSEDDEDTKKTKDATIKKEEEEEEMPESKLSRPVQELMQLIFNKQFFAATMADLKYDADKLPLGKLSKTTISRGFQALKDLSALLNDPILAASQYNTDYLDATERLSNLYFSLIPHAFGRNHPPVIRDSTLLKKEIELLESLSDMKDASLLMKNERKEKINELDQQFRGLGMNEMTPLEHDSPEFTQLVDYLMDTRGHTHYVNYQVSQIFRIERGGEKDRLETTHKTYQDRRLLWHGSRCTNFGGILSQGLRIAPPEAPVTVFGKGIYLADMSSKSANYCFPSISNGHALLLLCEAELGDPIHTLTHASSTAAEDSKSKGMLSTWGQGETGPSKWKDAECIHPSLKGVKIPDTSVKPGPTNVPNVYLLYNEYICYDISQVRLRYLLRVRM
ncbi:PARP-domain-containing protein [Daldinia caldariorum]|uniref:PARP-domain-containing protein n=1 Tax=Daldinia caldariorum TaxID=326644 RepID=UPI002008A374|nr:PARP-domain-containing protein [Daldinia caldariorum]KAI1467488.1 PARP-domain-containing protein [Daldinia caldariorum]